MKIRLLTSTIATGIILLTCLVSVMGGEIVRLNSNNLNLLPKGKEVDGMIGDWVIKNDKVIAVIGAASFDREANQMVSSIQGAVIDFTTHESNNDQLTVYYPQGARVDVPAAHEIMVVKAKGRIVQLKVIKNASDKEPYKAETIYTLKDGDPYLQVLTTYHNTSGSPVKISLSDKLRCDNDLTDVAPEGNSQPAFIYNKYFNSAYGIASTSQVIYTSGKVSRPNLILLGYEVFYSNKGEVIQETTVLDPGKKISIDRYLLTGSDVADVQQQYVQLARQNFCRYDLILKDSDNRNLPGAFSEVRNQKMELVSAAITKKDGTASLYMDDGDYTLIVARPGHDTIQQAISVPTSSAQRFTMNPQTKFAITVSGPKGEEMPVKVEFRGVKGTKNPHLGPPKRSSGAGNLYYSDKSSFEVPVQPGTYDIIFSHGPEFEAIVRREEVKTAESKAVRVSMNRIFETPNWIVADLHNHTTNSGDSHAEVEGRVINMAASGIQFAPATEHNRIADYSEVIKQVGLQKFLASTSGTELSGRPGPGDINHQNAFPLKMKNDQRGYGVPKTDKDPYVQMKRLYDYDNNSFKLMQQNHPNIGWLYFDKDRDGKIDDGFGTAHITDAMEINSGIQDIQRYVAGERAFSRLIPWLQMLNIGYRIYGTANSDNHTVGHASGSIFNYIYTCCDKPEEVNPEEIARQVKQGHVVMSNGPFIDVRVNGALPGDEIKATDGKLVVSVKAYHSNWSKINTIQILINGRPDSNYNFSVTKNPELFKEGPLAFEKEIPVNLIGDSHIIVSAYGEGENIGMINGGRSRMSPPTAMSNPVFVDVDGNGFKHNDDLLGFPLPTGEPRRRPSADEDDE